MIKILMTDKNIINLFLKTGVKEPVYEFTKENIRIWELISGVARVSTIINKDILSGYEYDFDEEKYTIKMSSKWLDKINTNNLEVEITKGVSKFNIVGTKTLKTMSLGQIELGNDDEWKEVNFEIGMTAIYSNVQDFLNDFEVLMPKDNINITITKKGVSVGQEPKGLLLEFMNKNNNVKIEGKLNKLTGRYNYGFIKIFMDILRKIGANDIVMLNMGKNKLLNIKTGNTEYYLAPVVETE